MQSVVPPPLDCVGMGKAILYKSVEEKISNAIAMNEFKPGERLPSPEKLAARWGVSSGTLRKGLQCLSAKGVLVRRPRLGTYVNPSYQSGQTQGPSVAEKSAGLVNAQKSNCIAMIVPDLQMFDYAAVVRGVEAIAEAAAFNIIIGNTEDDPIRLNQVVRQQLRTSLAGLIIATHSEISLDFDLIQQVQARKIPVVSCYRPIGLVDWPSVRTDGYNNTWLLTRHLAQQGRKRIAIFDFEVTQDAELYFKEKGLLGFIHGLLEEGLTYDPALHLEYPYASEPLGYDYYKITDEEVERVAEWLRHRPEVDAILCVRDRMAAIVVRALAAIGKKVPEDVAVAGFGSYGHLFGLGHDWLTSVDSNFAEIGKQACDLIVAASEGKPAPLRTVIAVKGTVLARRSTERPSQA